MACQAQEKMTKPLSIDFLKLAEWLPSVNDNAMPLLRQLRTSRSDILASRAGGRLACRYSVLIDDGCHHLRIEVTRAGREVPFGSVILCCETGRVFRNYGLDTETEGKREARQYFFGFEDATRYLVFAARLEFEAETRTRSCQFRHQNLSASSSRMFAASAA